MTRLGKVAREQVTFEMDKPLLMRARQDTALSAAGYSSLRSRRLAYCDDQPRRQGFISPLSVRLGLPKVAHLEMLRVEGADDVLKSAE